MTSANVLVFENTELDVVDIHQVPWLRGLQVASALGYKNPSADIQNLYDRNADEFTDDMTQVIDLPTAGGIQPVRIFSPRGCYLLGMLARTEKAKAFRAWALDVLEGRIAPLDVRPMTVPQRFSAIKLYQSTLRNLKNETEAGMRNALYPQARQLARMLGVPCPPLESIGRTIQQPDLPGV
ncbi:Bro-N domain-containing protein [Dechloromonas denitrificans]|uniref:BRO-N domain-containing protein n=1 Tax=Dechloromonas denitrificans TaxID=281362 RepID=UPI001CF8FC15|nr:Bro-N domain-containing protein [Dechloromonas denitrificans]UCV02321.1 Bro-N domain-containing protein [Dechloromonas denitrificans]